MRVRYSSSQSTPAALPSTWFGIVDQPSQCMSAWFEPGSDVIGKENETP